MFSRVMTQTSNVPAIGKLRCQCGLSRVDDRDRVALADATRKCRNYRFAELASHHSVQSQSVESVDLIKSDCFPRVWRTCHESQRHHDTGRDFGGP